MRELGDDDNFSALVAVVEQHNSLERLRENVKSELSRENFNCTTNVKDLTLTSLETVENENISTNSGGSTITKAKICPNSIEPISPNFVSDVKKRYSIPTLEQLSIGNSHPKHDIAIDRTLLLRMSSTAFESYVSTVSTNKPLTTQEEKQLKAQRRLISNRESAQASRKRKKAYMEELELQVTELNSKVNQLSENNAALHAQVNGLTSENYTLQSQIDKEKQSPNDT